LLDSLLQENVILGLGTLDFRKEIEGLDSEVKLVLGK